MELPEPAAASQVPTNSPSLQFSGFGSLPAPLQLQSGGPSSLILAHPCPVDREGTTLRELQGSASAGSLTPWELCSSADPASGCDAPASTASLQEPLGQALLGDLLA